LSAGLLGATVAVTRPLTDQSDIGRGKEHRPMRMQRLVRTLMVAGTAAALSILSIVSTVMAASGGGDFPKLR
jgi:hypothetical protein